MNDDYMIQVLSVGEVTAILTDHFAAGVPLESSQLEVITNCRGNITGFLLTMTPKDC